MCGGSTLRFRGGVVASPASSQLPVTPRRAQNGQPLTSPASPMIALRSATIAAASPERLTASSRPVPSRLASSPRSWPVLSRLASSRPVSSRFYLASPRLVMPRLVSPRPAPSRPAPSRSIPLRLASSRQPVSPRRRTAIATPPRRRLSPHRLCSAACASHHRCVPPVLPRKPRSDRVQECTEMQAKMHSF